MDWGDWQDLDHWGGECRPDNTVDTICILQLDLTI